MSKHSVFLVLQNRRAALASALLIIFSVVWLPAFATNVNAQALASVKIGIAPEVPLGQTFEIPITLEDENPAYQMGGFDFLIAYDVSGLNVMSVSPGSYLTNCEWEYFTYRSGTTSDCGGLPCPLGSIRIVAVAELNNGDVHPSCYYDANDTLAIIHMQATSHPTFAYLFIPIKWVWYDCGDNAISSELGDSLYISNDVYDPYGAIVTAEDTFPTFNGANSSCIQPGDPAPERLIDFHQGGAMLTEPIPSVRIGLAYSVPLGVTVEVPILLENELYSFTMGGYDFLLSYDPVVMSLLTVNPGSILNNCQWEYFTYRSDVTADCGGLPCPMGIIRVVALAETNNGAIHPTCYNDASDTLATMEFQVTTDETYECQYTAIKWVWYDCGDNAIASTIGDSLYISYDVYDFYDMVITAEDTFPTFHGANASCVQPPAPDKPAAVRFINYYQGGIDILCNEPIDQRGDINLNEIAYEIADYVLFTNYFLYGLGVFTINMEAQIAASDTNADGLPLTLSDLVYLYRVIIGDAYPFPKRDVTDTAIVIQDTQQNTISLSYTDSLSSLYLNFNDAIFPTFDLPDHTAYWATDTNYTLMLIMPDLEYPAGLYTLESGELFSFTGLGRLTSASACYDGISAIPTQIVITGTQGCCLARGNIDGDPTGQTDISDLVFLVQYLFHSGDAPPCFEEGDVNASGTIDISDLTFMVDFLFGGGSLPPPC